MESKFDFSEPEPTVSAFTDAQFTPSPVRSRMWSLLLAGVLIGVSLPYGIRYLQSASQDIQQGEISSHSTASQKAVEDFRHSLAVRTKALMRNLQLSERPKAKETKLSQKTPKKPKAKAQELAAKDATIAPAETATPALVPTKSAPTPSKSSSVASLSSKKASVKPSNPPSPAKPEQLVHKEPEPQTKPQPTLVNVKKLAEAPARQEVIKPSTNKKRQSIQRSSPSMSSFAQVINNARYQKDKLANCGKRCVITAFDPNGHPIVAMISGPQYARSLQNHQGTVNLSGQPRLIKNQQVLMVESLTFNIPATSVAKQVAKAPNGFVPVVYRPTKVSPPSNGDLVPGMVIDSRKQIPQYGEDEFDDSDTRLESMTP